MAKPAPLLVDPNSPAFSDTHAAARAIGNNFSDKGGEQAAAIIKGTDGQYRYTTSVPGTQDNFSMHVGLRQGESLAGIMHSHPGTDNDAKVFSPNDIDTANQLKVPSYVQFSGQNNAIRMYTPGVTKTRSVPSQGYQAGNMQVADGDPLPAPPKSTPTAPDQDIPPSAPPVAVTPVQGSQVSADDEFAGFSPADEFAGFAAAPPTPPPGAGEQLLDTAKDVGGMVAGGVGHLMETGQRLGTALAGGSPEPYGYEGGPIDRLTKPFQHAPIPEQPDVKEQIRRAAPKLQDTAPVKAALNTPLGQTATEAGGAALQDVGSLLGAAALPEQAATAAARLAPAGETSTISNFGRPEPTAPSSPGGFTRDDFAPRPAPAASPEAAGAANAPAPAPEVPRANPVPGKPHIRLKAAPAAEPTPEATPTQAPAPGVPTTPSAAPDAAGNPAPDPHDANFFPAPDNKGTVTRDATPAEEASRKAAVERGAPTLPQVRDSAITNNYEDQHRDWAGNQAAHPVATQQIGAENAALHEEAGRISEGTGGQQGTGESADAVRDKSYQDWHDTTVDALTKHINATYASEDAKAQQLPSPTGGANVRAVLARNSLMNGSDAAHLRNSVNSLASEMGVDLSNPHSPVNGYQLEQLRKHVSKNFAKGPDFASAMKTAVEADQHPGAYVKARALQTLKSSMFDNVDGINRLGASKDIDPNTGKPRPENRPVKETMKEIGKMDPDQVKHIVQTMKNSSTVLERLGDHKAAMDITDKALKAGQNLQSHFTENWREQAAKGGGWNQRLSHQYLRNNQETLNAVMHPEQLHQIRNVHNAGNVLDLDKGYKGAHAQFQSGSRWTRARAMAVHSLEAGAALKTGGISEAVSAGGDIVTGGAISKLRSRLISGSGEQGPKGFTRPLGQRLKGQGGWVDLNEAAPGAGIPKSQRGAVGNLGARTNMPAVTHDYDPATGEHTVNSANGRTIAQDTADGGIKALRSDTAPAAQRGGENTARLSQLADTAHAKGGVLHSDVSVSPGEEKSYSALSRLGYDVKKNPDAVRSPDTGNLVSNDPNRSVFSVAPKDTRPLGERLAGGKQRGAVGNPYDSAPVKKDPWSMERNVKDRTSPPATMRDYKQELRNFDWGNENVKNERLPQKEARTGNPYESGGGRTPLGQVLYGGKQRGAVGNLNPENTDYRGMHTAPYNGRGSPLHDLTDTYPPAGNPGGDAHPKFVWGEDKTPQTDAERLKHWDQLPKAGAEVNGLKVRDHVPNTSSISGSFDNYHVLSGVREMPFSAFENHITPLAMPSRLKTLRDEISQNKEINPLIVGIDEEGPYIIEGAHRYDALLHLGKDKFPAKVVVGKFDKPKSKS